MYLSKNKVCLFLQLQYPLKNTTMKLIRSKLAYLAIAAFIFLQIPIVIAGNSSTRHDYVNDDLITVSAVTINNTEELINQKADSIYESLALVKDGLSEEVFEIAYKGYYKLLDQGMANRGDVLTIADFSKASSQKRLYIINVEEGKILYYTLVAHGRNSGLQYANDFSNKPESFKSSLGFYVTMNTYFGDKGYSLKLKGVEKGINDRAFDRAIVLHGSDYVSAQFANNKGYLGRSLGCPAVPVKQSAGIINTIKNGSVLFIYHPDKKYKEQSTILNS